MGALTRPRGRGGLALALVLLLVPGLGRAACADEDLEGPRPADPAPAADAEAWPADAVLGVVDAERVQLRVGPRRDNHPVAELAPGTVVVIVERAAEWLGVRLPAGFPVALAAEYTEPVGTDALRVVATNLNLRVHPPEDGKPHPGAFRDHPAYGEVLPLIRHEGTWAWVLAPEPVRAYVLGEYVRELGPPAEHAERLERARAQRDERVSALVRSRRRAEAADATLALREAIGATQQQLYRLRVEAGLDRTPVATLADALKQARLEHAKADPRVQRIAECLVQDLEAEIALRLARQDAEVAALRGLLPEAPAPLTPAVESLQVTGIVRFEAAPKWRDGGVYVLWIDEEPRYVLRLTTGVKGPLPDLAGSTDGRPRTVRARQPGERVFGLPALDVLELRD